MSPRPGPADEVSYEPYVADPVEHPPRPALADVVGRIALAAVIVLALAVTYLVAATQLRQDPSLDLGDDAPAAGAPAEPDAPPAPELQEAPAPPVGGTEGDVVVPGEDEPTPFAVPEPDGG